MNLDGATLLTVELMLSGLAAVIWLLSAFVFKSSPKTSIQYSICNILIGLSVLAYFFRTPTPTDENIWFAFVFSDIYLNKK